MALPEQLLLQVVSADRLLVDEPADEVEIPGADGYFGVLPAHTPLLAALKIGELSYRRGTETHYLSIAFGFAEIQPDRVTVLAQTAERAQDIDFERARVALLKSLIRLQVAGRVTSRS